MRAFFFIPLLVSSCYAAAQECTTDPSCSLDCSARGTCCKGGEVNFQKEDGAYSHPIYEDGTDYQLHEEKQRDGNWCMCDEAYTGVNCEHSVKWCNGNKDPCYHGGACLAGSAVQYSNGERVHTCDCVNATERGVQYIGLHCEVAAPITPSGEVIAKDASKCDEEDNNFCVNGGKCKSNPIDGGDICECPPTHKGRHCQLSASLEHHCNLECTNGGGCQIGPREATKAEMEVDLGLEANDLENYQHCQCPIDWIGRHCQKETVACGTSHCYHGSKCVSQKDTNGGDIFNCDCSAAANVTHSFAGTHCEIGTTSFCSKTHNANGQHFCLNGGTCSTSGNGIYECNCSSDFRGAHCEYPLHYALPNEHSECTTKCLNHGKCREGAKDQSMMDNLEDSGHLPDEKYNEHFEHCVCPHGWSGANCEVETMVCRNGQHICLHGGKCVSQEDEHKCDCESFTAGRFCEHKATNLCTNKKGVLFCVNHGECQDNGTCKCPSEFVGKHCEAPVRNNEDAIEAPSKATETKTNSAIIVVFAMVATFIILVAIAGVVTMNNKYKKEIQDSVPIISAPAAAAAMVDTSKSNNLEDKQFI